MVSLFITSNMCSIYICCENMGSDTTCNLESLFGVVGGGGFGSHEKSTDKLLSLLVSSCEYASDNAEELRTSGSISDGGCNQCIEILTP